MNTTFRCLARWIPGFFLLLLFACPSQGETATDTNQPPKSSWPIRFLQGGLESDKPFDPSAFLKQHFFGYEPFYFLGGWERPRAKIQISLRYQILAEEGSLVEKVAMLRGFNFAYTQTSLWDLGEESSPFLDTSYKPEVLYRWERANGPIGANWMQLDLQAGLQHESNGNPEIDSDLIDVGTRTSYYVENGSNGERIKTSRSLNILYLKPTFWLGTTNKLQLALSPRAWFYIFDMNDNPDLDDYRGYADLQARLGWRGGLQLLTTGRLGKDGDKGSLQWDLSYPLMRLFGGNFSVYIYAQYFTGYGESLLLYKDRSDALRFGLALFR